MTDTQQDPPSQEDSRPLTKSRERAAVIFAGAGYALLLDAAIETFISASVLRWWVAGTVATYLAVTALVWRLAPATWNRVSWAARGALSCGVLAALLAATSWLPEGLTHGMILLRLPTSTMLSMVVASGVAIAGVVLVRIGGLPAAVRAAIATMTAYGIAAFVSGAVAGTPLPALFAGQSLWKSAPFVLQGACIGGMVLLPLALLVSIAHAGLRRPRAGSLRATIYQVLAIATGLAIVVAAVPPPGRSARGSLSRASNELPTGFSLPASFPAGSSDTLDNSLRAIEDGERGSARDHWDPAYVVERVGPDPDRLFAWVRTNTFWVPYRGLLRGPTGVLMDRLGNSLDRAVLLATLLRQAGQTVRLAHGTLARDQAKGLLPVLLAGRILRSVPFQVAPAGGSEFKAIATRYGLNEAALSRTVNARRDAAARSHAELGTRVSDQTRRLGEALHRGASLDDRRQRLDEAGEILRDHWWVQRQHDAEWQDFDLLAPSKVGQRLTDATETLDIDAVGDALHHDIVVRVIAEQWAGGTLTQRTALERSVRPAELIGTPIVLQFWPTKWPAQLIPEGRNLKQAFRMTVLAQHEWLPILQIGQRQFTQLAVRDSGEIVDAKGEEPAAQLGRSAARGLTTLTDLFGAAKPQEEPPTGNRTLTAVWIEYETQVPGASSRTIRREVFDLLGPAARASKRLSEPRLDAANVLTRSLGLMMATEILPVVCQIDQAFLTHLTAQSLLGNQEMLRAAIRGDLVADSAVPQLVKRFVPAPSPLYQLAVARLAWGRFADEAFIDRPNLLTRHVFLASVADGFALQQGTDIVSDEIGVDPLAADPFSVRLEQGVLDTNAEALLPGSSPSANTSEAFKAGGAWVTLTSPGDPRLSSLALTEDSRSRIDEDLAAGYTVVAPRAAVPIGSRKFAGWWRVDRKSGDTLGIGDKGWGQDLPEFALIVEAEGLLLAWLFGYFLCRMQESSGPVARACDPSTPPDRRLPGLDLLIAPVEASGGSPCLWAAYLSMLMAGLTMALDSLSSRLPSLLGSGGSPGAPGTPPGVDPLGTTAPASETGPGGPGATPAVNPLASSSAGAGAGSAGAGGPGASGSGPASSVNPLADTGVPGGGGPGGGAPGVDGPVLGPGLPPGPTGFDSFSPAQQQAEINLFHAEQALQQSLENGGGFSGPEYDNFIKACSDLRLAKVGGRPAGPSAPPASSVAGMAGVSTVLAPGKL